MDRTAHGSTDSALSRRDAVAGALAGAVTAAALGASSLLAPAAALAEDEEELEEISVSARATVAATPDVADISLTVETADKDAATAQNDASEIVAAATQALVDAGIDEEHLTVSNMNVTPHYDYGRSSVFSLDDTPRITGYTVSVRMSVKGISTDEIGAAIAAAAGAGVNRIDGVSYSCSNYDALYEEALGQACTRAARKADVAAAALGYEVVGFSYANLGYENQTYRATSNYDEYEVYEEEMAYADGGAAVATVSFDPGTVEIGADVSITFLAKKL